MTVTPISLQFNTWHSSQVMKLAQQQNIADMLISYLKGEPVYIQLTSEPMRKNAIARLQLDDDTIQNMLHGDYAQHSWGGARRKRIEPKPENVRVEVMGHVAWRGAAVWDGRKNKVNYIGSYNCMWLKGHTGGTVWSYEKPEVPKVDALDKLGREIKVGDFISYILYQFQGSSAAGIYYGKVTKIENNGTVWAKNIKLKNDDRSAEKAIKENGLIVIMSDDLMKQLMMARLSSL